MKSRDQTEKEIFVVVGDSRTSSVLGPNMYGLRVYRELTRILNGKVSD